MPKGQRNNIADTQKARTKEERTAYARLAGKASGEARRRNRDLRQIAAAIADTKIKYPDPDGQVRERTMDEALILRQYQKAVMDGDTTAAKFLAEILGEVKTNVAVEGAFGISVQTKADADAIQSTLDEYDNA